MASVFKRRKHLQAKWKDIVQSFPFQEQETYETVSVSTTGKSRAFNFKSSPNGPFMMIFNAKTNAEQTKPEKSDPVSAASSTKNLFPAKLESKSLIKSSKNLRTTRDHTLMIETMPTEVSKTLQDPLTALSIKGKLELSSAGLTGSALNLLSPTECNNHSIHENNSGKFYVKEPMKPKTAVSLQRSASMYDKKTKARDKTKVIESVTSEEDLRTSILRNYQRILENSRKESVPEESSKMQSLFADAIGRDEISLIHGEHEKEEKDLKENSITRGVLIFGRNADSSAHLSRSTNILSRKVSRATIRSPVNNIQSIKILSPQLRSPSRPLLEVKISHRGNRDNEGQLGKQYVTNFAQERAITSPDKPVKMKKMPTRSHKHRQLKNKKETIIEKTSEVAKIAKMLKEKQKKELRIEDPGEEESMKENESEREEVNMVDIIEKRRKELLLEYAETLLLPDPDPELVKIETKNLMKGSPVKDLFTTIPHVSQKLHENIEKAHKDLEVTIEKNRQRTRPNAFLSNDKDLQLNELDIQAIKSEYDKKAQGNELPNYEMIDSIVSKLKFFLGKVKSVRLSLIKAASFKRYNSGDIIFKQGDYGDLMYIILRGSVNVRIKKATIYGTVDNAIVAVLYDGSHFGEYAMLKTFKKNKKKEPVKDKKLLTRMGSVNMETGEEQDDNRHREYLTQKKEAKQVSIELPDEKPAPETQTDSKFEERSKRAATIEVAESCDLLCIPRQFFQAIFLGSLQKELDEKVQVLLCLPFFNKLDTQSLAPLANNIKAKIYKMGDVLLHAGNKIDRLTIIARGRCKVALEVIKRTDAQPMHGLRGTMSSLKNLEFGKVDYKCTETNIRKRDASKDAMLGLKSRPTTSNAYVTTKAFGNDKIDVQDGKILTREYVTLRHLIRGDFFGGRGMLEREDINEYNDPFNKGEELNEPARVSVIVESSVVEVFELPKDMMKFIPNFLLKILIQGLINMKEFDEYDLPKEKEIAEKWFKFKEEEIHYAITHRRNTEGALTYKKF